jgi:hypothetical protein
MILIPRLLSSYFSDWRSDGGRRKEDVDSEESCGIEGNFVSRSTDIQCVTSNVDNQTKPIYYFCIVKILVKLTVPQNISTYSKMFEMS